MLLVAHLLTERHKRRRSTPTLILATRGRNDPIPDDGVCHHKRGIGSAEGANRCSHLPCLRGTIPENIVHTKRKQRQVVDLERGARLEQHVRIALLLTRNWIEDDHRHAQRGRLRYGQTTTLANLLHCQQDHQAP